jgi:hypothetical protein
MASTEVVSKAEAARRWNLSKSAISKYCAKGMPVRDDGRLDWPVVASWRTRYVGFEPLSPKAAREAKAQRATPVEQTAEAEALEEARQEGRWAMLYALAGPEATERALKVMLRLGFTPKHALQGALWAYFAIVYANPNERDCAGPGGGIPEGGLPEPDWEKLLPATKRRLDPDAIGEHVCEVADELFSPAEQIA